jgi:hypothetical protein
MKYYQAVRISANGRPTYGDKYARIGSTNDYAHNDVIEIGGEKYLILFKED